ncbi:MAG: three-Cys-motif partner protein TcmP [Planctomycetes bacterium]|nr:three-Cys-motif partner protein TcmP [Planctomycetota bacterium]
MAVRFDEIGYWSEIKLDIIKKYAAAYSVIMNKQSFINNYYYIDGFAGAGKHISKNTKEFILGSPAIALNVNPPFSEYHFIDLNGDKADMLRRELGRNNPKVKVHEGDCNKILIDKIFPLVRFENYNRALCLLDPYGIHLKWEVLYAAGKSEAIEVFLNFSVMDMNMNVLRSDPEKVDKKQINRMNAFWGDESWREAAYEEQAGLFGKYEEKTSNQAMAKAFRKRLKTKAGFSYVPEPLPMRNTTGSIIYYLFFASPKKTGKDIFAKYKNKGLV